MQHDTAPDKCVGQHPVFVCREHHQRRIRARVNRRVYPRHGEGPLTEHLQQPIGHAGVGLVDLIDEQHDPRFGGTVVRNIGRADGKFEVLFLNMFICPTPIERPPHWAGHHITRPSQRPCPLGSRCIHVWDLGIRETRDRVVSPQQVLGPSRCVDKHRHKSSPQHLRRRPRQLTLACPRLSPNKQRPVAGQRRVDSAHLPRVEHMDALCLAAQL